jgi:uncharacterized protein (DUF1501 family)
VLVVLTLIGGNDALNTIVPLRQYDLYRRLRPTLAWRREELVPLPDYGEVFGLNPGLQPLAALFAQRKLALINGCGPPAHAQGLFDHEASLQNFQTGELYGTAPPVSPTGWLGRYLDEVAPGELPAGIDFASLPLLLTGLRARPFALAALSGVGVFPSADAPARALAHRRLQQGRAAPGVAADSQALRRQVLALSGTLQSISDAYRVAPGVTYPLSYLGSALHDCAALIAADRGVRALSVSLSGFDTHGGQNDGPPDLAPLHQGLWATVSEALAAFYADLKGHGVGQRVVTLVCSEFGRRSVENSNLGTDHGFAGSMLAIGDPVRGGVYGEYPDLRPDRLVLGANLDVHVDFRAVYATILAKHLGADPEPILRGSFPPMRFL